MDRGTVELWVLTESFLVLSQVPLCYVHGQPL